VLSGARDGSVRVWNLETGGDESGERHWALVSGCAMLPDGQMITATKDGAVWSRRASMLEPARELGLHDGSVDALAVTPDGTRALSISRPGTVKLWNVASRRCERTLTGFAAPIFAGALTPDGRRAVLALADGRLEVRDLHGPRGAPIPAHQQRVFGCAVSADGQRVISASEDGTVRVFDLDTLQCLGVLYGTSWFRCVAAASGIICAGDQEGNLWMIADGTATTRIPGVSLRAARTLTPADSARLRHTLASIYESPDAARALTREVGLDATRFVFNGVSLELWDSVLTEASKQHCLDRLVQCALRAYREDPELRAIAKLLGLQ